MSNGQSPQVPAPTMSHGANPVLVVDDEEVIRMSLRDLLEGEGYPVLTATSGEEALEIVEHQPVQMIITDIQMPGIFGPATVTRNSRACFRTRPVVIMTAFPTVDRAIAALCSPEPVNFITKPFDIGTVLDTVSRTCSIHEQAKHNLVPLSYAHSTHTFDVPWAPSNTCEASSIISAIGP